jgi:hypothetical protein
LLGAGLRVGDVLAGQRDVVLEDVELSFRTAELDLLLGARVGGLKHDCALIVSSWPWEALAPAGRPAYRSWSVLVGPESKQCARGAVAVPASRAAVAQAAPPGVPNRKYWGVIRELSSEGS